MLFPIAKLLLYLDSASVPHLAEVHHALATLAKVNSGLLWPLAMLRVFPRKCQMSLFWFLYSGCLVSLQKTISSMNTSVSPVPSPWGHVCPGRSVLLWSSLLIQSAPLWRAWMPVHTAPAEDLETVTAVWLRSGGTVVCLHKILSLEIILSTASIS